MMTTKAIIHVQSGFVGEPVKFYKKGNSCFNYKVLNIFFLFT